MTKVIAVVSFVVVLGYIFLDVSWADKHIPILPDGEERLPMPVERNELIGPVLGGKDLSQITEPPSMKWLNLIHTDPHHLPGIAPHHSVPYRNFQAPDGAALMFNWTFDKR